MTDVLLVTGMSGAGRSTVSTALDDLGWFVIDNLPLELIVRVGELASAGSKDAAGVAFIVGRSGRAQPEALLAVKDELETMHESAKLLFLDAPDDVLIHRYEGTRRRHPHEAATLADSIAQERVLLQQIRDSADIIIDTGTINTNQLRSRISEIFMPSDVGGLRVSMMSFGFSHGLPRDVDLVFDVRFLPNPHWVQELRPQTGLDEAVANYVLDQEPAQHFLNDVVSMLQWQIPAFASEGKSYLTIAIGCTGGRHRSVAIAEEIRRRLDLPNSVFHRDIAR
jgi:UPF0042 nucleotide-binding protein